VGELLVGQDGRLVVRGGAPRWCDARGRVSRVDPSLRAASNGGVLCGGPRGWRRWHHVIPRSEKEGTKPPYVCPGCSNHTHGNN
jgi:hypothetical protein